MTDTILFMRFNLILCKDPNGVLQVVAYNNWFVKATLHNSCSTRCKLIRIS